MPGTNTLAYFSGGPKKKRYFTFCIFRSFCIFIVSLLRNHLFTFYCFAPASSILYAVQFVQNQAKVVYLNYMCMGDLQSGKIGRCLATFLFVLISINSAKTKVSLW